MRPVGATAESCLRQTPERGVFDFGAENVMRAEEAVGPGCVAAPGLELNKSGVCVEVRHGE